MMQPRALITGITGMVGSHLADYLVAETDWNVFGMCRWRSPLENLENLVPMINRGERVSILYGDLRDTLAVQDIVRQAKPDYVFHLAAQSYPRTSFEVRWIPLIPISKVRSVFSMPCVNIHQMPSYMSVHLPKSSVGCRRIRFRSARKPDFIPPPLTPSARSAPI